MPNNIEINQLFCFKRFPENELKILCLVLYLPVGIVLFILRTILALSVVLIGCSLSDTRIIHKLVNKIACLTLGITVTVENPDKKENVEVYISNNLSIFDHLAVHTATGSVSPGAQMHPALARGLGVHYFGTQTNLESFKKNVADFLSEQQIPVHFTPEEKITNGKALLKFKSYPFSLTNKVQPVCISIERPFLDLSVTTLRSSYWTDVLFYMFSPLTNYKLKFLPPLEKKSVAEAEFSEIVRQNIASALKVETPELTAADLLEWEKRQLVEQQRAPPVPRPSVDSEVRRMATQVKDVLPHVPLNAIYKDLNKTRNVDTTITNILEGRVHFVPEQISSTSNNPQPSTSVASGTKASPSTSTTSDRDLFNTAASSFARSAHERNKSFQERKEQLIANARRRYIEKHDLKIPF
ncbi:lipid droplet-regulating VLDL assembly factor AUP1 [Tribolium castaneum]|uniref:Lipid droplet-regulating VLDL assembly factor AUP1 n=1 Tax=Tribolium castaneum TaxID=7070 RepID=D6WWW6_TRICA|nr:PREDICTED: ancient ubiquitous protein 1 [Tribolium castaneum]EFA08762.1 Ancient ubiquitous protein 1-like Protein [Tribolium castaneum]|eukprot:XP_008197036.1 PREDICTED: ancient ubiquitous protein 1 [Tribolium castaneum]